jgi:hypothetical protein
MSANDTQVGGQHYKGKKFQPWDWDKYGIGTYEMDILHYVTRQKGGKQDLEKAVHYVDKLEEQYHLFERRNRVPAVLRVKLYSPCQEYCEEWKMSALQREAVRTVLTWQDLNDLMGLKAILQDMINAYPDPDVRADDNGGSTKTE